MVKNRGWGRAALLALALMLAAAICISGCVKLPALAQKCGDGTAEGKCSVRKPYLCQQQELFQRPDICGCPEGQLIDNGACRNSRNCSFGIPHGTCSGQQPLYCNDGSLIPDAQSCGCPEGQVQEGSSCRPRSDCDDGTADKSCSEDRPKYCHNGSLVDNASACGCGDGFSRSGDGCIDLYPAGEVRTYRWSYKGRDYAATLTMSESLEREYAAQPGAYTYYGTLPPDWKQEYYGRYVTEGRQQRFIGQLVESADEGSSDERLRALLSFVQSMPYDYQRLYDPASKQKYAYETLYTNIGLCGDKSILGAAIARQLGYGVALFEYEEEKHMALGVKCPRDLSNYGSGYCFIEMTTECQRFTDNSGDYLGAGRLRSTPEVLVISDGRELERWTVEADIRETREFEDAKQKLEQYLGLLEGTEDAYTYNYYVGQYNSYVDRYNGYLNCTGNR